MTTVFIKTLKPFITMSQIIGLMNFGCALKSGLLHRNLNSTYYLFLEIIRIFVFLICSYHIIFNMGRYYIMLQFNVIQYWMLIITARISEKCMIKYDILSNHCINKLDIYIMNVCKKIYSHKTFFTV